MQEHPSSEEVAAEVARIKAEPETMATVRRVMLRVAQERQGDPPAESLPAVIEAVVEACGSDTAARRLALIQVVGEVAAALGSEAASAGVAAEVASVQMDALLDVFQEHGDNPPAELVERALDEAIRTVAERRGESPEQVREAWNREDNR
jgi:hypothetical protein